MLDYTITDINERKRIVEEIVNSTPASQLTPKYLTTLANYLIYLTTKDDIVTLNRNVTISKREVSQDFDAPILPTQSTLGGAQYLSYQDPITKEDLENIPQLVELTKLIKDLRASLESAQPQNRKRIKETISDLQKERIAVRNAHRATMNPNTTVPEENWLHGLPILDEKITLDDSLMPTSEGLSCLNSAHCRTFLLDYQQLRARADQRVGGPLWCSLMDFDSALNIAFESYPSYKKLIAAMQEGWDIREAIKRYGAPRQDITIPIMARIIAATAQKEYIRWHYSQNPHLPWASCSKCGERKPLHPLFFYYNDKSSKRFDTSNCIECRKEKNNGSNTRYEGHDTMQ